MPRTRHMLRKGLREPYSFTFSSPSWYTQTQVKAKTELWKVWLNVKGVCQTEHKNKRGVSVVTHEKE